MKPVVEYTRWYALYEDGKKISFLVPVDQKPGEVAVRMNLPPWQDIRPSSYEDLVTWVRVRKVQPCPTVVHCIECRNEFEGGYNHYLCKECCSMRTLHLADQEAEWAYATIVLGHCRTHNEAQELKCLVYAWCVRRKNFYPMFRVEEVLGLRPWVMRVAMKDRVRFTGKDEQTEECGLEDFMTALTRVRDDYRESFFRTCSNWTELARRRGVYNDYLAGVEEGVRIYTSREVDSYDSCDYEDGYEFDDEDY